MTDTGSVSVSSPIGEPSGHEKFWQHHIQTWRTSGFRVDINEEFDSKLLKKLLTVLGEVSHAL